MNFGPLVLICMLISQDEESFNYGRIIFNHQNATVKYSVIEKKSPQEK
jgi:hypothetical protein